MSESKKTPESARRPTPRPKYETPMAIRRDEMAHHVWGDSEAGFVSDRVISSTDQLHVLEFELPPGGEFRHSPMNQTIFAADVLYYCLQGDYILANPQTGEVVIVPAGTGRLFQRGTWNHGFNPGQTTVRVLEYFSPPPSRGAASDFAKTQPPLDRSIYSRMDLENWPMTKVTQESKTSFWEVSDATALYSFRDSKPSHLIGRLVETAFLSVIKGAVYPGHVEDFKPVETESVIYALEGELWVDVWSDGMNFGGTKVLQPGEAMFLPVGCQERMLVRDHSVARYLKGSGSVPANWRP